MGHNKHIKGSKMHSAIKPLHVTQANGAGPHLTVSMKEDGIGNVLLAVEPPALGPPPRLDVCIVIDTSGSMGESANPNGSEQVRLFSKLDLAKRGAEVIARALGADDSLTVFSFNSSVEQVLPRVPMDRAGLTSALTALHRLEPGGGTALWDGLHAGLYDLEVAHPLGVTGAEAGSRGRNSGTRYSHGNGTANGYCGGGRPGDMDVDVDVDVPDSPRDYYSGDPRDMGGAAAAAACGKAQVPQYDPGRHGVVILLTDGQPSESPPAGEVEELRRYVGAREEAMRLGELRGPCKLVTMGFGYDVNSKLLLELAQAHCAEARPSKLPGAGAGDDFAFIPDGTMLLTTFVNLMANLTSTVAKDAVLRIVPAGVAAGPTKPSPSSPSMANAVAVLENAWAYDLVGSATATATGTSGTAPAGTAAGTNGTASDLTKLVQVMGDAPFSPLRLTPTAAGVGLELPLGDVLYGQQREVVLRTRPTTAAGGSGSSSPLDWSQWLVSLEYQPAQEGAQRLVVHVPAQAPTLDVPLVTQQLHRSHGISSISQATRLASLDLAAAQAKVKEAAVAAMALQGLQPHPVLEDLLGQVSEALATKESWGRWGAHYTRSLACAHRAQACNNFKDPGVLAYGGDFTRTRRDELSAMCDALPVPVPSIRPSSAGSNGSTTIVVSATTFKDAFNNRHGGCFGPSGQVLMSDGSYRAVQYLRKGDSVAVHDRLGGGRCGAARVVCVITYRGVKTVRLPGSGLSITPWHPVRVGGQWRFPADVVAEAAAASPVPVDPHSLLEAPPRVYNLVLDSGHVVVVDGVEAVTLGHGFQEDVLRHPFFGTAAVVQQLQALPGWQQGYVCLDDADVQLGTDGQVCGYAAAGTETSSSTTAAAVTAVVAPLVDPVA